MNGVSNKRLEIAEYQECHEFYSWGHIGVKLGDLMNQNTCSSVDFPVTWWCEKVRSDLCF